VTIPAKDEHRQLGELTSIVSSRAGSAYLAEAYTIHDLA
jgi:p-hydroxybenzoate 3-monooxygenase